MCFQMIDILGLGLVVLVSIRPDVLVPSPNQVGRGPEYDGVHVEELENRLKLTAGPAQDPNFITRG